MNHNHPALPHQPHTLCATFARLAPLLDTGELDLEQEAWARDHMTTCVSCRRRYAGYDIITTALRRQYGGMRAPVALPTAEEMMRIADTDVTEAPAESPARRMRGPRSPHSRRRLPIATAITAATVLAVIGTLFALRGHSQPTTPGASHTPQTTHGTIVEFSPSGKLTSPTTIVADKDGVVWVLDPQKNGIGRISPGDPTAVPPFTHDIWVAPTANSGLTDLAIAPDGSVWFTESNAHRIGRINSSGDITEFKSSALAGPPSAIVANAKGAMWYTALSAKPGYANSIVPIHPDGTFGPVLMLPYPDPGLVSIAHAPDDALWLVEANNNRIDRFDPALMFTAYGQRSGKLYSLPHPASDPVAIAAAPDSSAWFVERGANAIGHISPSGKVTEYPVPTPNSGLTSIAVAADGSAWFTEAKANRIGHITPGGAITEIAVPTAAAGLDDITIAPDGRIWFTETASGKIGYVTP